jgi:hypothetical protein
MKLAGLVEDGGRMWMSVRRRRSGEETFQCSAAHRVELHFCWYDLWVGAYWDAKKRTLYVCPLPTLAIVIQFRRKP